ncbi:MAG: glycosyltransferase [Paludibacteraceae bacterium]|nr:glycosyltransferase [Paludibacteraceae bacterium]
MTESVKILIILVLYRQSLEESRSYHSLKKNLSHLAQPHQLILFNNSPERTITHSDIEATIVNAQENGMLAKAYNHALTVAQQEHYDWIMLFDQDSEPDADYFKQVSKAIETVGKNVAAIVPHIISDGQVISPSEYSAIAGPFGSVKPVELPIKSNKYINAINSCSVIRTESIASIGGFDERFPLDYLDCWYFYQFHKRKYDIEILDVTIPHNLSILSPLKMGDKRYRDYMKSCARFSNNTQFSHRVFFKIRTLLRCAKMLFFPQRWVLLKPTFAAIFYKE